jgi:hypothetical protein
MNISRQNKSRFTWIKLGRICGLLAFVSYFSAAFLPLPDIASYIAAFSFGPLLAIGLVGLYHALANEDDIPLLQIASAFGVAAGVVVLLMLTVQQAIFKVLDSLTKTSGKQTIQVKDTNLAAGLNSIHFGLDIAWDVLISIGVVLYSITMLHHPQFGKIIGAVGIILGGFLLAFNIYYFPHPPASANAIDLGPFVALWFVVVFILMFRTLADTHIDK